MSFAKMNVFHWHISDSQSFPLKLSGHPELVKGAWHPEKYYSVEDVREIIQYAKDRGIIVIPELDIPAHCESWSAAHPELFYQYFPSWVILFCD